MHLLMVVLECDRVFQMVLLIQWLEDLLTLKKNFDGCLKKFVVMKAVLNSLVANVPKTVVLRQVEKAKENMLNQSYSSISAQSMARIEELLQKDQNVIVEGSDTKSSSHFFQN